MGSSREAATREATPSTATRTRAEDLGVTPHRPERFPRVGSGASRGGASREGSESTRVGAGPSASARAAASARARRRAARRREPPVRVRVEVHDASRGEETVTRRVPLARHEHRATRVRAPGRGGSGVLAREVREALDALVAVRTRVVRHHHEARRALVGRDGVAEATQSAVHRVQGDGATAATGGTEEGRRRARPRVEADGLKAARGRSRHRGGRPLPSAWASSCGRRAAGEQSHPGGVRRMISSSKHLHLRRSTDPTPGRVRRPASAPRKAAPPPRRPQTLRRRERRRGPVRSARGGPPPPRPLARRAATTGPGSGSAARVKLQGYDAEKRRRARGKPRASGVCGAQLARAAPTLPGTHGNQGDDRRRTPRRRPHSPSRRRRTLEDDHIPRDVVDPRADKGSARRRAFHHIRA